MAWLVVESLNQSAQAIMDLDLHLLEHIERPTLHFYTWKNESATYGHFIDPSKFFNLKNVQLKKLDLAKRPTGGGILFHLWDFAFSVLIPVSHARFSLNTLENYAWINERVIQGIKDLDSQSFNLLQHQPSCNTVSRHFCYAHPTKYDITLNGCKIGGAAQRKTKKGFLHQGSIATASVDKDYLFDVLLSPEEIVNSMQLNSSYLAINHADLKQALIKQFCKE